jgi:hypothetical protein
MGANFNKIFSKFMIPRNLQILTFRPLDLVVFGIAIQHPMVHHLFSRHQGRNGLTGLLDLRLLGMLGGTSINLFLISGVQDSRDKSQSTLLPQGNYHLKTRHSD